jgi:ArsR family transcriptional regulator
MKTGKTHKEIPWSQIRVELSKDEAAAQGDAFLVLRNKTRLRIIHLLRRYGGLLCVSEIAEALDENPSVISSHLAILRGAGMVSRNTYQAYAYYSLTEGTMEQYKRLLETL